MDNPLLRSKNEWLDTEDDSAKEKIDQDKADIFILLKINRLSDQIVIIIEKYNNYLILILYLFQFLTQFDFPYLFYHKSYY